MREYGLVSEAVGWYNGSNKDLVVWHYCNVLTAAAVEKRRGGDVREVEEGNISIPNINVIGRELDRVGIDRFFEMEETLAMGLNRDEFVKFVGDLERKTSPRKNGESILEL